MKYSIEWMESKTSAKGNKYATCSLKDETGKITTDVAIFSSFPNFENLKAGEMIEGELESKDYQGKVSYTLKSPILVKASFTPKAGVMKEAQETKRQNIATAQENKELGIKVSSTIRMAVDTALVFLQNEDIKDIGVFKEQVKEWRKFYWMEWDKDDKDFSPF